MPTAPLWRCPPAGSELTSEGEGGEPCYPKYFTDHWAKACVDAGVPVTALHDARHTSASTGADAGVPERVMQRRLGHADSRTTREVYTHGLRGPRPGLVSTRQGLPAIEQDSPTPRPPPTGRLRNRGGVVGLRPGRDSATSGRRSANRSGAHAQLHGINRSGTTHAFIKLSSVPQPRLTADRAAIRASALRSALLSGLRESPCPDRARRDRLPSWWNGTAASCGWWWRPPATARPPHCAGCSPTRPCGGSGSATSTRCSTASWRSWPPARHPSSSTDCRPCRNGPSGPCCTRSPTFPTAYAWRCRRDGRWAVPRRRG
ncbi:tyrosine-type recombinase/integrase [Micromonospora zhanjiangensis]